jgi:hypothetical protein
MIDLRGYLKPLNQASSGSRPGRLARSVSRSEWPRLIDRPERGADPVRVRARLSSYQRALTSARKSLPHPAPAFRPGGASLFTTISDGGAHRGSSAEQGGDQ